MHRGKGDLVGGGSGDDKEVNLAATRGVVEVATGANAKLLVKAEVFCRLTNSVSAWIFGMFGISVLLPF